MKKITPIIPCALALAMSTFFALPGAASEVITFDPTRAVAEYAANLKTRTPVSIVEEDGSGLLTFRSNGGGELLILQNNGVPVEPNGSVDIEFRAIGPITMGVFQRAHYLDDLAYMAFLSSSPDGTVRLTLAKTVFESAQRPGEDAIAQGHSRGFAAGEWAVLRFTLEDLPSGNVLLRASVIDQVSGEVILEIEGEDKAEPLAPGGVLGMRFFTAQSADEKIVDIRNVTLGEK